MFRQEVDPLADTVPPRYAYESDEEDEVEDLPVSSLEKTAIDVNIVIGDKVSAGEGKTLIVANGEIGALWARGAKLGQQVGQVSVNKRAIGLVFRPDWTTSAVIVSEALSKLPVWAMYPYAEAIISRWHPSSIVILEVYSVATYVSPIPIPHHEAPLRYLHTELSPPIAVSAAKLEPFAPPNLLQTSSAAFASILSLPDPSRASSASASVTILLAPSSRASKPAPHLLHRPGDDDEAETSAAAEGVDALTALLGLEASEEWDPSILRTANCVLLAWAGVDGAFEWYDATKEGTTNEEGKRSPARRRVAADNSMYI